MRISMAALGSAGFFLAAPGIFAGFVPWLLTHWQLPAHESVFSIVLRVTGAALLIAAVVVLVRNFVRFVIEGRGTPAPIAPTQRLVIGGDYRYVRNPMYVAVVSAILGQALLFGSTALLVYAVVIWACMAAFVYLYEEPKLRTTYGVEYERYCAEVKAWWPRWHARHR